MCACFIDVTRSVGMYLDASVGPLCYNSDKVLSTVLDQQNLQGFATIILRLAVKSGAIKSQEQLMLNYQWLEHIAKYSSQAFTNLAFAKVYLEEVNEALGHNSYLTGQELTVADIATYYVLYEIMDRLSMIEKESLIHLCRWFKHIQSQPKVCRFKAPLLLNSITLSVLAPVVH